MNFSNLDFEAINTKILAYETQEKEGKAIAAIVVEGDNATIGGPVDEGHVKEVVTTPWKKTFDIFFFLGGVGVELWLPPILRLLYLIFKNDRYSKMPPILRLLFFVSNAIFRL